MRYLQDIAVRIGWKACPKESPSSLRRDRHLVLARSASSGCHASCCSVRLRKREQFQRSVDLAKRPDHARVRGLARPSDCSKSVVGLADSTHPTSNTDRPCYGSEWRILCAREVSSAGWGALRTVKGQGERCCVETVLSRYTRWNSDCPQVIVTR